MSGSQIELLNPVADVTVIKQQLSRLLDTLEGKTVGIVESSELNRKDWRGWILLIRKLRELLPDKYGAIDFVKIPLIYTSAGGQVDNEAAAIEKSNFDEFAKKVDCAVVGAGF